MDDIRRAGSSGAARRRRRALAAAWQLRVLLVGLVVVAVVALALPRALALPSFGPEHLTTPSTLIVAWLAAILAAQAGFEPAWDLYATEGTRVRVANLGRIAVVAVVGGVICASILGTPAMTLTALTWLLGLSLLGASVLGHRLAWITATAYLLIIIGAGAVDSLGAPRLWAAPASSSPGSTEILLASALLLLGVVAWWRSSTRQASLHRRY